MEKANTLSIFTKGILKENPLLVLSVGLCSSLVVCTNIFLGIALGISTTVVLVCSEFVISLFKKLISDSIILPISLIVLATFTTLVYMLMRAYFPEVSESLGIFLPLIAINVLSIGRIEKFTTKNSVAFSILDSLGMGVGYTIILVVVSFLRELLGSGTIFSTVKVIPESSTIKFFAEGSGAFFIIGILCAIFACVIVCKDKQNFSEKNEGNK